MNPVSSGIFDFIDLILLYYCHLLIWLCDILQDNNPYTEVTGDKEGSIKPYRITTPSDVIGDKDGSVNDLDDVIGSKR